jgi:hypothetical protein
MKIIFALLCSVAIALSQAPPIQRQQWTTNVPGSTIPSGRVSDMIITSLGNTPHALWSVNGDLNTVLSNTISGQIVILMNNDLGTFELPSGFRVTNGAGSGKFMMSDANGNGTWQPVSANTSLASLQEAALIDDFSTYPAGPITVNGGMGWTSNGIVTATNQVLPRTWMDGVSRNVLQMTSRGEYIRPWPWGTNWIKLRFAILWGVTNVNNTSITNTWFMGICKGTNGGVHTPTNQNAMGIGNWGGTSLNNSNIAVEFPYYDAATSPAGIQRTNGATYTGGISFSGSAGRGLAALPHFAVWIFEVEKNLTVNYPGTNDLYTFRFYQPTREPPTGASGNANVIGRRPSLSRVLTEMQLAALSTTALVVGPQTLAAHSTRVDAFGQFDSFVFSWGGNSNLCEVAGIVGYKLY